MALSCFLLPPGICLTSKIIHCHQLREYYFIRIFCSIFYNYWESQIIHLVYTLYTALSVNHMMTSPFIIEKFERVFHYMSYNYIVTPSSSARFNIAIFFGFVNFRCKAYVSHPFFLLYWPPDSLTHWWLAHWLTP